MKIAIAGYGVEGKANFAYWNKPGNQITIVDERETVENLPPDTDTILGDGAFSKLADFDLVIRTAGLAPSKIKTNGKIWSATNEFFAKCPAPIIGVTGTKGKGTTASLIHSILKAGGKTSYLVGNIGQPALAVLDQITLNDAVVYELSSFQLWDLETSPHIAVVLAVEPDHLDVHKDFEDYKTAKSNITRFQKSEDLTIYNSHNKIANQIATLSAGHRIAYSKPPATYQKQDSFYHDEQKICSISHLKLPGKHNIENACAAIEAAWPYVQNSEKIALGLSSFKGLPHRLELVEEIDGVKYYDDSFSASTVSTQVAVEAFAQPKVLILGGYDRGVDFTEMVSVILKNNIRKALLIGQTASRLAETFQRANAEDKFEIISGADVTMSTVITAARKIAESGDIVLLSPGCPSFDMFANFKERGEQFQLAVERL